MRCLYVIVRIMLVVLIMVVVINFLLVFNPFSNEGAVKENAILREEESNPKDNMGSLKENNYESEPDEDKDIIGYSGSGPELDMIIDDQALTGNEGSDPGEDYFLTYDEIVSISDISFRDKLLGISIINKIGKADLERILRIADGGITYNEWNKLNGILKQHLDNKDMESLEKIIDKNKKLYEDDKLAKR